MNLHEHELPPRVADHLGAVAEPAERDVAAAQTRLMRRLTEARAARAPRRWWPALATAAAAMVLALGLPLLSGGNDAFAAALERFRTFRTLEMRLQHHVDDRLLQQAVVRVNAEGVTRTDVDERMSIIVDPVHGRLLTLMHESRTAMRMTLPATRPATGGELDWLEELRRFKGQAEALPQRREIDGQRALGWSLSLQGQRVELWTTADGLPLALSLPGTPGLRIEYRFRFDLPMDPALFSSEAPAGYRLAGPDAGR